MTYRVHLHTTRGAVVRLETANLQNLLTLLQLAATSTDVAEIHVSKP